MMRRPLAIALLIGASAPALAGSYAKTEDGIIVTPDVGQAKAVRLQFYGDRIVRVTESPDGKLGVIPAQHAMAHGTDVGTGATADPQ